MSIGEVVKMRRLELHYTQGDLAHDICTQAMISKFERGELEPNSKLIEKIASRLRVTVSYFYGEQPTFSQDEHIIQFKKLIDEELSQMNTDKVPLLLETNKDLIKVAVALEDIYFFEWVKGFLFFYKDYDSEKALETLKAIPIESIQPSDLAIDVLNSIASIYSHLKQFEKALEYYEKVNFMDQKNTSIETKANFLFNFALCLKENNMYKRSLGVTLQSIDAIIKNRSLVNLGKLYWLKGLLFLEFTQYEESIEALETALVLFKMEKNDHHRSLVLIDIQEVKNNMHTE